MSVQVKSEIIEDEKTLDLRDRGRGSKRESSETVVPPKRKRDRFHGMSEEEVLNRTLPDLLVPGLDICIVGINPGLTAAYVGHHYAGPGNHFWKCLYLSGLIPEPLNAYSDADIRRYGIGFTNIVERTTRGSADLKRKEIAEGAEILKMKVLYYKPKIVVFNGKGIYEVFCGHKKFSFGKQPAHFPECPETVVFVMPSSSARCAQLPRAVDKVPFYNALRKLKEHMCNGLLHKLEESEVTFPDLTLKTAKKQKKCTDSEVLLHDANDTHSARDSGQQGLLCAVPIKIEKTEPNNPHEEPCYATQPCPVSHTEAIQVADTISPRKVIEKIKANVKTEH